MRIGNPNLVPVRIENHYLDKCLLYTSDHSLIFSAADRLDLNITSSLIAMTQNTLKNWSEDYYGPAFMDSSQSKRDPGPQQDDAPSDSSSTDFVTGGHFRKRVPFVPFLLRNETGAIHL